ncbi:thioredoxin family protein [Rhodoferax mekongensis]|uniref:thioredoxin family protein n=1 Tax=Rhodoferax mekongensis TaxID=3068341 RepID=UPI0028BE83D1|nr:thioredoxin family protein [Rhodoferax sp. TBRC 17199]MDT7515161.1 thioredoxin family protein [Rhodoferax sp. TBRC 17199]
MSQHLSTPAESATAPLLVACLCAQWCGTCKDYQPLFTALQAEFPGARMQWVDVEDEADLVDPIEVENFPTLLIAQGERATFFGTVTPHLETLRRLIQSSAADGAPTVRDAEVQALVQRLGVR